MQALVSARFAGVVAKRLAAVECAAEGRSNQHELNAGVEVKRLLGGGRLQDFPCRYLYFGESGDLELEQLLSITYYDSREAHPTRSEFRLTYPAQATVVSGMARAGDFLWLAMAADRREITVVVSAHRGPSSPRLDRYFDTGVVVDEAQIPSGVMSFAPGGVSSELTYLDPSDVAILEALGIRPGLDVDHVAAAVEHFGGESHPTAAAFAEFARARCTTADPRDDPDRTLADWFDFTYDLFLGYEVHVIQPRLDAEFARRESIDVGRFFSVAKSLTNSRFSRAGGSFESHVAALFDGVGLRYSAQVRDLPDGSKPDFLLPGREFYASDDLEIRSAVSFVGAKTTTKERWRQLAGEAEAVGTRHMVTMDTGINASKAHAMKSLSVVPVLPRPVIDECYDGKPFRDALLTVSDFVMLARDRQERLGLGG